MTGRRRSTFSAPEVRKALKLAAETGRPVSGYEVTPEGVIRVMFATAPASDADAALDAWQRGQRNG